MKSSLLLVLLALPAAATETRWTATGTVTSVTGTGLTATVGAPVSVKFTYDSGATVLRQTELFFSTKYYYYGPLQLSMEATIGESKWTASLPVSPLLEVIYAEAQNGLTDTFRITTSSDNSGVTFDSFPYTGTATDRKILVELQDTHNPSLFMVPGQFPNESVVESSISTGKGEIKAGTDSIKFSINLGSVKVETGTPFKVTLEQTATGVRLRWPTEAEVNYFLYESDDCDDWEFSDSYIGDGQEKVVDIEDAFSEFPLRRFYKVESQ